MPVTLKSGTRRPEITSGSLAAARLLVGAEVPGLEAPKGGFRAREARWPGREAAPSLQAGGALQLTKCLEVE